MKPEVHTDEDLWDLEQETGLPVFRAFVGLWNCSDREGRFEWRPRALKSEILPYWDGDFSRVLDALASRGFVVPYASGTRAYGVVRTFKRHQVVNNREAPSELPPPPRELLELSARERHALSTPLVHARVEGEGNGNGTEGEDARAPRVDDTLPEFPALTDDEPQADEVERMRTAQLVRVRFERRIVALRGAPPAWSSKHMQNVHVIATWLETVAIERALPVDAVLEKLLDGFFGDAWVRSRNFPLTALANDPARYLNPTRDVRSGYVEAAPAEAFKQPEVDPDDLFGPLKVENDTRKRGRRAPQEASHG